MLNLWLIYICLYGCGLEYLKVLKKLNCLREILRVNCCNVIVII